MASDARRTVSVSALPETILPVRMHMGLAQRIKLYLEDSPIDGGHSDTAGANAYELLEEAMYV